jgi:DNA-binding beta-propeller fold protein YncE
METKPQEANDPQEAAKVNMANILADWQPSDRMRMYIRKDIVAKIWNYGAAPVAQAEADPYAKKQVTLAADKVFGSAGTAPGQFQRPRGIAVAPDGSLYIADTGNHRIQHLSVDGKVLAVWGQFGDLAQGEAAAPPGTFNAPWDVAVGPDGSVYVADTWNQRIQVFAPDPSMSVYTPVREWSIAGWYGESLDNKPYLAVDGQGHLFAATPRATASLSLQRRVSSLSIGGSTAQGWRL